jgi:hypothetical protein
MLPQRVRKPYRGVGIRLRQLMCLAVALIALLLLSTFSQCPVLSGIVAWRHCQGLRRSQSLKKLRLQCKQLIAVDWEWLRARYGEVMVYAQDRGPP